MPTAAPFRLLPFYFRCVERFPTCKTAVARYITRQKWRKMLRRLVRLDTGEREALMDGLEKHMAALARRDRAARERRNTIRHMERQISERSQSAGTPTSGKRGGEEGAAESKGEAAGLGELGGVAMSLLMSKVDATAQLLQSMHSRISVLEKQQVDIRAQLTTKKWSHPSPIVWG